MRQFFVIAGEILTNVLFVLISLLLLGLFLHGCIRPEHVQGQPLSLNDPAWFSVAPPVAQGGFTSTNLWTAQTQTNFTVGSYTDTANQYNSQAMTNSEGSTTLGMVGLYTGNGNSSPTTNTVQFWSGVNGTGTKYGSDLSIVVAANVTGWTYVSNWVTAPVIPASSPFFLTVHTGSAAIRWYRYTGVAGTAYPVGSTSPASTTYGGYGGAGPLDTYNWDMTFQLYKAQ